MNGNISRVKIEISSWTVIKVLLAILAVIFLYYIRDVVLILFVAVVLSAAFNPWTNWLQKRGIPRSLGILTLYLIALALIITTIALLVPPVSQQLSQLSDNFPVYWQSLTRQFFNLQQYSEQFGLAKNVQDLFSSLQQGLDRAAAGFFSSLVSFFGGLAAVIVTLVTTFYLVVEQNAIKKLLRSTIPPQYQSFLFQLYSRIQQRLGWWLRGQLILCLIIGVLAYIGLLILGVQYPAILALIAGLTEVVPYLGPVIGAVPAVFFAFFQSPLKALLVIALYYIIQWTENNLIVPKVMQRATGLNPLVVIVAIMVGVKVAGLVGVLLAIPAATILNIIFEELFVKSGKEQKDSETLS